MASIDLKTKSLSPTEEPEEMPLPSDPKTIFLGCLVVLALLAAAYVASQIVLPLAFAMMLSLLLQPALRVLERWYLPRAFAAFLLIVAAFGMVVGVGTAISGPAATWAAKLPEGIPRLQERLSFLREPVSTVQQFVQQVQDFGGTASSPNDAASAHVPALFSQLFAGTRSFAAGLFTTVLFLFFLLVSGDIFLLRLIEIMPRFGTKRQVVEISQQIELDISAYLVTITIMNALVGVAMALTMWLTGAGDPIFWGTVAFLLNYAPILGTVVGAVTFLFAGLLTIETLWQALLPACLYLVVHVIEGAAVTPMLVAKRFTLNPVLVVVSLVFWSWMWGVPGVILAVPMLAVAKIVCDRVRPLAAFGHFLEG
jgi:predicted PurR-regulated permease PerM